MKQHIGYLASIVGLLGITGCGATPESPGLGDPESADGLADDIGTAKEALSSQSGTRPLLVVLVQKDANTPLAHNSAWYTTRIFGPAFPNIPGYFSTLSKGKFTFSKASVVSVVDRTDAAFTARAYGSLSPTGNDPKRLRDLMLADDAGFSFAAYDTNGDGKVTGSELAVLAIDNYSPGSGQTGAPGCVTHPSGVQVCTNVSLAGHQSDFANYAHELSHQLGTIDAYGANCNSYLETLMSCTVVGANGPLDATNLYNIDPWHRGQLGWVAANVNGSLSGGSASLQPVGTFSASSPGSERITIDRGSNNEKLYIENRKADTSYDRNVAQSGIVFWYTKTNSSGTGLTAIPALADASKNDNTDFVLATNKCVGDPNDPKSRGQTSPANVSGASYRFKWLDGTDTGLLFSIGSPNGGAIPVTWSAVADQPACPQSPPGAGFAWVNVTSGAPNSLYSYSTSHGPITVTNPSTGTFTVSFANLARTGGNVQAVAYGSDNVRCQVQGWAPTADAAQSVTVHCTTPSGAATNSAFVVKFTDRNPNNGAGAYLWANSPSSSSYTPSTTYNWNSTGAANTITRSSTGVYTATLPGLATSGGTAQVTSYGSSGEYCKVQSWGSSGADEVVNVRCFAAGGAAADALFSLSFLGNQQVAVYDDGAYAWANDSSSSSYSPFPTYSYDSTGTVGCGTGTNTAGRYSAGRYFIRHSAMTATNSAAQVTAYGTDSKYCKVVSWVASGNGVEVGTQCYASDGTVSDSLYVEGYATGFVRGPC